MIQGNGLRDAYSATLDRIKAQGGSKSRLGMDMLMWLSHSERPLSANELCHALGVEIGSADLDPQNIPAIETLLGCSLGLVSVEASSYTARLVHYTLHEYLSNNTNLFHSPHTLIAEVCLTYLNSQSVRDLSPILRQFPTTPLLEYASCYWGTHAGKGIPESVNTLALRLLDEFDKHVSSGILLSRSYDNWVGEVGVRGSTGFTGLHCTAYFGIMETTISLLKVKKCDLDATDVMGNTAVSWATRKGHRSIVKTLLERKDITPSTADKDGRTPLFWAEYRRDIVQLFLKWADVTPDTAGKDGRTPLSWAAGNGDECIVKRLLGRGSVTPNTVDDHGRTPLSWAAGNGQGDIVEMLLKRKDVIPDTADKNGRTPLLLAAKNGHGCIAGMLLLREDVTSNTIDIGGRTPLSLAAGNGHGDIVQVLLEWGDATPDTTDEGGMTPLSWAARNGHRYIVEMLLKRKDAAPDTMNRGGQTPLPWAAVNGEDGARAFLEREGVTPDTADQDGRTPLSWAEEHGHIRVVEMFPERHRAGEDMAMIDLAGQTPLLQTSERKRGRVLKRKLGDQSSVPQSVGSNSPVDLFIVEPSELSHRPSKRIRRS